MLLDRIKITNYKSYGTNDNILDVHPQITTIIGKNGSGKSNIIDFIKYFKPGVNMNLSSISNKYKNLNNLDDNLHLQFELLFDNEEQKEFSTNERTIFTLEDDNIWHFKGGLFNIIANDKTILYTRQKLLELFSKSIFKADMKDRRELLKKEINSLHLNNLANEKKLLTDGLNFIKDPHVNIHEYVDYIETLHTRLLQFYALVPTILSFDDKIALKDSFSITEVVMIQKKQIESSNKFLALLVDAFQINIEDIIFALSPSNTSTAKKKKEREINKIFESKTTEIFEQLHLPGLFLSVNCKDNILEIFVINDDTPVALTERSNGLKWYLSLYLQMKVYGCLMNKSIILIDEPGQSVHIEAQKQILSFFDDISKSSQIIYTTHSPFMIDTEDLSKIVVVEKISGMSIIHNKVHNANLENSSKLETLSPLYQALGYSCQYNIGPTFDKNNIITEGITDYYYLLGFIHYFNIKEENIPNIIPSISVDNIHLIASILIGWNCRFKILVDYDDGGYRQIAKFKKLELEQDKDFFTVNGSLFTKTKPNNHDYVTIEKLLTEDKYQNVDNNDKLLLAKEFYDNAKAQTLTICEESTNNIKKLLKQLGIYSDK